MSLPSAEQWRLGGSTQQWRLGSSVPINVYEGNRPICQCHTIEDALRIVTAVNASLCVSAAVAQERERTKTFFLAKSWPDDALQAWEKWTVL